MEFKVLHWKEDGGIEIFPIESKDEDIFTFARGYCYSGTKYVRGFGRYDNRTLYLVPKSLEIVHPVCQERFYQNPQVREVCSIRNRRISQPTVCRDCGRPPGLVHTRDCTRECDQCGCRPYPDDPSGRLDHARGCPAW